LRGPGIETRPPRPRRSLSDLVLGAEIAERLEDVSDLDLRDVDVVVLDGEVTLTGAVRSKLDRRRIENVADIDGVRHVQNNLRVRSRSHWTFL
jgi:osmotically-inducible protein OsmY